MPVDKCYDVSPGFTLKIGAVNRAKKIRWNFLKMNWIRQSSIDLPVLLEVLFEPLRVFTFTGK